MNINKDNIKPPYAYITKPLLEAVISELPVFISMVPSGRESFFQSKVDQKVIVSVMKSQHYGNNVETITLTLTSNTPVGNTFISNHGDFKVIPLLHSTSEISLSDNSENKYKELVESLLVSWASGFLKPEMFKLETFNKDFINPFDENFQIGFEKAKNNKGYTLTLNRGDELLYLSETTMTYGNVDRVFNNDITNLLCTMFLATDKPIGLYLLPQQKTPGIFDRPVALINS